MNNDERPPLWLFGLVVAFLSMLFLLVMRRDIGKARKAARKREKAMDKLANEVAEQVVEDIESPEVQVEPVVGEMEPVVISAETVIQNGASA